MAEAFPSDSASDEEIHPNINTYFEKDFDYKSIIERIMRGRETIVTGFPVYLHISECRAVIDTAKRIFEMENFCLELPETQIIVCGNMDGHVDDLIRLFKKMGLPPSTKYLFLGNFINLSNVSLESLILLLCLKIEFPNFIYLLRGLHESCLYSLIEGLRLELEDRYGSSSLMLWRSCLSLFDLVIMLNNNVYSLNFFDKCVFSLFCV
jgi:hypothetical protein